MQPVKKFSNSDLALRQRAESLLSKADQDSKNGDFSVVLMDVQMPERDGLETTKIIREMEKSEKKPHIPIIAITAHALPGDKEMCLEAGMDDYIAKPINPSVLQKKLAKFS